MNAGSVTVWSHFDWVAVFSFGLVPVVGQRGHSGVAEGGGCVLSVYLIVDCLAEGVLNKWFTLTELFTTAAATAELVLRKLLLQLL